MHFKNNKGIGMKSFKLAVLLFFVGSVNGMNDPFEIKWRELSDGSIEYFWSENNQHRYELQTSDGLSIPGEILADSKIKYHFIHNGIIQHCIVDNEGNVEIGPFHEKENLGVCIRDNEKKYCSHY